MDPTRNASQSSSGLQMLTVLYTISKESNGKCNVNTLVFLIANIFVSRATSEKKQNNL